MHWDFVIITSDVKRAYDEVMATGEPYVIKGISSQYKVELQYGGSAELYKDFD